MKEPLVSVVLPTYNRAYCITKSINSVLNQDYNNLELIIVDDNSTDDTTKVIEGIGDDRIKYFKLKENKGASYARNYGINKSVGDYIAFQDSDDIWYPQKLQVQMEALLKLPDDYAMVYCSLKRNYGGANIIPSKKLKKTSGLIFQELVKTNFISTQTILCRKKNLLEVGCFDERLPAFQDWDLVLRIARRYKIGHVKKVLVKLETSDDSITKNKWNHYLSKKLMLDKYKGVFSDKEAITWKYHTGLIALNVGRKKEALNYFWNSISLYSRHGIASLQKYVITRLKLALTNNF